MEYSEEKEPPDVITSDTDNATQIRPDEAPAGSKRKFKKFRAYNTGMWNGPKRENKEQVRRQDDLHRYDSLASSLAMNTYQRKRGRHILDGLDFQELGIPIDHIIFGLCVLVANEFMGEGKRYYPRSNSADDEQFREVGDDLGLSLDKQVSAIERLRSRVEF